MAAIGVPTATWQPDGWILWGMIFMNTQNFFKMLIEKYFTQYLMIKF